MSKMKLIAAAAALSFAIAPITSTVANAHAAKAPCYGVNSCKGKSHCKTAGNDSCKGKNSCKGKGMMMKSAKACKKANGSETDNTKK